MLRECWLYAHRVTESTFKIGKTYRSAKFLMETCSREKCVTWKGVSVIEVVSWDLPRSRFHFGGGVSRYIFDLNKFAFRVHFMTKGRSSLFMSPKLLLDNWDSLVEVRDPHLATMFLADLQKRRLVWKSTTSGSILNFLIILRCCDEYNTLRRFHLVKWCTLKVAWRAFMTHSSKTLHVDSCWRGVISRRNVWTAIEQGCSMKFTWIARGLQTPSVHLPCWRL